MKYYYSITTSVTQQKNGRNTPIWIYVMDGTTSRNNGKVPRSRWRTRGKHAPGSGNYECFTCEGGYLGYYVDGQSDALLLYPGFRMDGLAMTGWGPETQELTCESAGPDMVMTKLVRHNDNGWVISAAIHCTWPEKYGGKDRTERTVGWLPTREKAEAAWKAKSWGEWHKTPTKRKHYEISATLVADKVPDDPEPQTWLDEEEAWAGYMPSEASIFSGLLSECVEKLPQVAQNNVENAFQVISKITDIASAIKTGNLALGTEAAADTVGGVVDATRKVVGSAWLGYRYDFNTTKMDIEEARDTITRFQAMKTFEHFTQRARTEVNGTEYRCSASYSTMSVNGLQSPIERAGMDLSAQHAWDLIPYSFIADWFLDVGGRLERADNYRKSVRITPTVVWFSKCQNWEFQGIRYSHYARWSSISIPRNIPANYISGEISKSGKTWIRRGLDVLAFANS